MPQSHSRKWAQPTARAWSPQTGCAVSQFTATAGSATTLKLAPAERAGLQRAPAAHAHVRATQSETSECQMDGRGGEARSVATDFETAPGEFMNTHSQKCMTA